MKEDVFEREIKRFMQTLFTITGFLTKDKMEEALMIIEENYDEQSVEEYLNTDGLTMDETSVQYKKLLFMSDLLYNKIWALSRQNKSINSDKEKYLLLANKIQSTGNIYDYSLAMKIESINKEIL